MRYQAVVFDLDGTLANTLQAIANSGNHMLREFGRPQRPVADFRYLAGQGLRQLVIDALGPGANDEQVQRGMKLVLDYYSTHRFDTVEPYEGITDMLAALRAENIKLAVLTNKPHEEAVAVVDHLFGDWRFDGVLGVVEARPVKPHPAMATALLQELGVEPKRCAYVGDTKVDMQTGRQASMFTVGVTWGFRDEDELRHSGAQAIIHHPSELPPLLR